VRRVDLRGDASEPVLPTFVRAIQPELERETQKVMNNREAFVAWLDGLAARSAVEAKRQNLSKRRAE
jgi:hypothetical protein